MKKYLDSVPPSGVVFPSSRKWSFFLNRAAIVIGINFAIAISIMIVSSFFFPPLDFINFITTPYILITNFYILWNTYFSKKRFIVSAGAYERLITLEESFAKMTQSDRKRYSHILEHAYSLAAKEKFDIVFNNIVELFSRSEVNEAKNSINEEINSELKIKGMSYD